MKGKFDAYVLWPLAKKFQNWIHSRPVYCSPVCCKKQQKKSHPRNWLLMILKLSLNIKGSLIKDQFGIIQNLQISPICQTKVTTWLGLFCQFLQQTGSRRLVNISFHIQMRFFFQNANEQIKTYLKQFNEIETNFMDWAIVRSWLLRRPKSIEHHCNVRVIIMEFLS